MEDQIYEKLRQHLDTLVLGAPEGDSILEILRLRFTPEEAEVALVLGAGHRDLADLARRAGREESELRLILERMADKALVHQQKAKVEEGISERYCLLPTAVGLWETSFANGENNPRAAQLARLWREYYKSGWGKSMFGGAPFTRVIPVEASIDYHPEILSYEKASELIKQHDFAVVIHCPCRKSAELDGAGCGRPTEVCFHFGDLARFMAEKGYGRRVSRDEVMEILDMTEKAGLVHMVGNSQEMGVAMCSCCTCCCTQLRAIAEMPNPHAVAKARFRAQVTPEKCVVCGVCKERCWAGAVTLAEDSASVAGERCYGCGLCVTACPAEAVSLKVRESYREPPGTGMELYEAWCRKSS